MLDWQQLDAMKRTAKRKRNRMKIKEIIADMGPNGLAHLFLALRDAQEQVEDSNGPGSAAHYEAAMREVMEAGGANSGIADFLAMIAKLEKT